MCLYCWIFVRRNQNLPHGRLRRLRDETFHASELFVLCRRQRSLMMDAAQASNMVSAIEISMLGYYCADQESYLLNKEDYCWELRLSREEHETCLHEKESQSPLPFTETANRPFMNESGNERFMLSIIVAACASNNLRKGAVRIRTTSLQMVFPEILLAEGRAYDRFATLRVYWLVLAWLNTTGNSVISDPVIGCIQISKASLSHTSAKNQVKENRTLQEVLRSCSSTAFHSD